jgi:hypothetical protein
MVSGTLLLMALSAAPVNADARASDAIQLYASFCVKSDGTRDRALAVLGNGNALANRLPVELTDKLLLAEGSVGWAIRSPNDAQILLAYSGSSHCEVRVSEAGEAGMVADFEKMQADFGSAVVEIEKPKLRKDRDAVNTFRGFKLRTSSTVNMVAMTTSNKKVGEQQHLLTFDVVSK